MQQNCFNTRSIRHRVPYGLFVFKFKTCNFFTGINVKLPVTRNQNCIHFYPMSSSWTRTWELLTIIHVCLCDVNYQMHCKSNPTNHRMTHVYVNNTGICICSYMLKHSTYKSRLHSTMQTAKLRVIYNAVKSKWNGVDFFTNKCKPTMYMWNVHLQCTVSMCVCFP